MKPRSAVAVRFPAEAEELGDLVGCFGADFTWLSDCLLHKVDFHKGPEEVDNAIVVENAMGMLAVKTI